MYKYRVVKSKKGKYYIQYQRPNVHNNGYHWTFTDYPSYETKEMAFMVMNQIDESFYLQDFEEVKFS